ncbi:hypothetical protein EG327_005018, partial [Venturia inaequalis]
MELYFVSTLYFSALVVAQVDPIRIKGTKFVYKTNKTHFHVKSVAYQDQGHFALPSTSMIDSF